MERTTAVVLSLVASASTKTCLQVDTEPAEGPATGRPSEASASSSDPPPPPGVVLPKVYGDGAPRMGPFERSSVWTALKSDGTAVRHEVNCDSMQHAELRAVLSVLFAGAAPNDPSHGISPGAEERLRIEWREHGKLLAISRLFSDGTLVREHEGSKTVERRLSPQALEALDTATERAGLGTRGKRWCAGNDP